MEIIEPLQADKDSTTKRPPISVENERNFLDASGEIMEHFGPLSSGAPKTAAMQALRLT